MEMDDKKSFVSKRQLTDGQDKAERPKIAMKQTFTGGFCGTYLPL